MIHHPDDLLIQKFAKGELNTPLTVMVSAHMIHCKKCQSKYETFIEKEAYQNSLDSNYISKNEYDQAFSFVMEKSNSSKESLSNNTLDNIQLDIFGLEIKLPSSLSFLKKQKLSWKDFGNKNSIAPIIIGPEGNFYLIYIGPNEAVPQHDHSGIEYSYVISGSYHDGISSFNSGDFSEATNGHRHGPKATSKDGCLVISWVEGRLNYFEGFLRPLNSLLWWYLHRA